MPVLPAFCDTCGSIFGSGIFIENSTNISFSGNTAGPCPNCGGMGHIPDGVFNFIGNTIEILSAPERTITELSKLVRIIEQAKVNNDSKEQIIETIKRETPALSKIADILPANRTELYGFLALILAALQILSSSSSNTNNIQNVTVNNITVNQVITQASQDIEKADDIPNNVVPPTKQGRNKPCKCGSGVKYKKCCGQIK